MANQINLLLMDAINNLGEIVQEGRLEDMQDVLEELPADFYNQGFDYAIVVIALEAKQIDMVHFLIDNGFCVYRDRKSHNRNSLLHSAVELCNLDLISKLLSKGASYDIGTRNQNELTPVHLAIQANQSEIMQLFLSTFDAATLYNQFLLHYAVEKNKPEIVYLLLQAGYSVIDKNSKLETPFCIAIKKSAMTILDLLWTSHNLNNFSLGSYASIASTYIASMTGNIDYLKKSVSFGFPIERPVQSQPGDWSVLKNCNASTLFFLAVKHIQLEIVKYLLEIGAQFTNKNNEGLSPICLAVKAKAERVWEDQLQLENNNQIIEEILGATIRLNACESPEEIASYFHIACMRDQPEFLEYFLQRGAAVNDCINSTDSPYHGFAPLHLAAKYGCKKNVEMLLQQGGNVNQEGSQKSTPLHVAVQETSVEIVEILVKHGASIFNKDAQGDTPIHSAFRAKRYEILDLLLSLQTITDSNPKNAEGISHFHIACTRNNIDTVDSFIKSGVCVNTIVPVDSTITYLERYNDSDWHGYSPLHFAVSFNNSRIVQLLLHNNANAEIRDARGFTPLHLACQYVSTKYGVLIKKILENFIAAESYLKPQKQRVPQESISSNSENTLKNNENQFDGSSDSVEMIDWSENRKQHVEIINLLINYKVNVNCLDNFGNGPLYYACCEDLNKLMDTAHSQIILQTMFKDQILTCLSKEMDTRRGVILEILFQANVNPDKCYHQSTILHYICLSKIFSSEKKLELAELFLQKGADVNARNTAMETPLHSAVKAIDEKLVSLFLSHNANVNSIDGLQHSTPLHIATSHNLCAKTAEIIKLLINKGPNVNLKLIDGTTPLHNLVSQSLSEYADFEILINGLLRIGANVNTQDANGKTPLFKACSQINEAVNSLIGCGADINIEDKDGKNVLYYIYETQAKPMQMSNQSLDDNVINMLETIFNHLIKLRSAGLYVSQQILIYRSKLREILIENMLESDLDEDQQKKIEDCKQEIEKLKSTKIDSMHSLYDIMFKDESAMAKHIKNDTLIDIYESPDFFNTFRIYGGFLDIKCMKGLKRCLCMPYAKYALNSLAGFILPEICSENILKYITYFEMKEFLDLFYSNFT